MRTTTGAGGKKYGPIGYLRRHSTPREVSGDACRVRWSGVAINATNRVHQCVFSPSHTGYMAARPGTSTYGSYRPQRPCSTIPLGVHLHTGHAAVSGARGGPRGRTSSRRPRWWSAHILYGRYGHIGRLSVSPIQIVWGFHRMFKYCKTFVLFQKLTGGGDSTLITVQCYSRCLFCYC